jgi:hypothetical protein
MIDCRVQGRLVERYSLADSHTDGLTAGLDLSKKQWGSEFFLPPIPPSTI